MTDAEEVLRAIDNVIADRGVPERDCALPLPQRVDNIIVELKNWRHWYGEAEIRAENAEAEIMRLRGKLNECGIAAGVWDYNQTISPEIADTFPEAIRIKMVTLNEAIATLNEALADSLTGWGDR